MARNENVVCFQTQLGETGEQIEEVLYLSQVLIFAHTKCFSQPKWPPAVVLLSLSILYLPDMESIAMMQQNELLLNIPDEYVPIYFPSKYPHV